MNMSSNPILLRLSCFLASLLVAGAIMWLLQCICCSKSSTHTLKIQYVKALGSDTMAAIVSDYFDGITKDTTVCVSNTVGWLCFYAGHDDFPWTRYSLQWSLTNSTSLSLWRGFTRVATIDLIKCYAVYHGSWRPGWPIFCIEGDLFGNWGKKRYFPELFPKSFRPADLHRHLTLGDLGPAIEVPVTNRLAP